MSNVQGGFPYQVCWFYNRDLEQGYWPGPGEIYINPIGAQTDPQNPPTNITDKYGNLLALYEYGTTGTLAPAANPGRPIQRHRADHRRTAPVSGS